jgi:dTDP-4-dehydrorhamnose reductase
MRIAIVGGTGLLGSCLACHYQKLGFDVKAFSRRESSNINGNLNNIINFADLAKELNDVFITWIPDLIINAVAIVNLQQCEDNVEEAYSINVAIPKKLAQLAGQLGCYFIQISTDHYYDDNRKAHSEEDSCVLLNEYAKTKYQAEHEVLAHGDNVLVARTNIIGFRRNDTPSFFEWLVAALKNQENIVLFDDFVTSPISTKMLGDILIECFQKQLIGIYNISSKDSVSKYDFGRKVADAFSFSSEKISKGSIDDMKSDNLKRAKSLGLCVKKIEAALDKSMPSEDVVIDRLLSEYKEILS